MKTLALANGDLVLGARGYLTVSGYQKTVQDIGVALRERYGVDRFHPQWGSMLPLMIGEPISVETRQRIESEVRRVVANYMAVQRDTVAHRLGEDSFVRTSEMLAEVEKIEVVHRDMQRFDVTITMKTMDRNRLTLSTSVEG